MRWPGILVALVACSRSDGRLYSDSDIKQLTDGVTARLAENAKRSCTAPKMLGATTPDPVGPELIALVEGTPELAPCTGIEEPPPTCGPLLTALAHRAAAHDHGCSPWQVGVRAQPARLFGLLQLAKVIAAEQGDPMTVLGEILDAARTEQDAMRGHVTRITSVLASKSIEILAARAGTILETAQLTSAQLDDLAGALDRLIAAMPTFGEDLAGDRDFKEL